MPPRFLVLACDQPGASPVPTILQRFGDVGISKVERLACMAATFLIRNGRRSFYSTILSSDRSFVRLDPGCMSPINDESHAALHSIAPKLANARSTEIHWKAGDIIVIDNWRVMHGRGRTSERASPDRRLLRVAVQ